MSDELELWQLTFDGAEVAYEEAAVTPEVKSFPREAIGRKRRYRQRETLFDLPAAETRSNPT